MTETERELCQALTDELGVEVDAEGLEMWLAEYHRAALLPEEGAELKRIVNKFRWN